MPKATLLLLVLFLCHPVLFSQQPTSIDQLALKIPETTATTTAGISAYIKDNFKTDTERIRAIFVWVAGNINYDVDRLLGKGNPIGRQPVEDVVKTRKAVCGGYADLFKELCNQCSIRSMVIGGYVKQKGVVVGSMAHAWNAVELDHSWYLFDPTWAAGYVNGNKFTKRFSETYYKLTPADMIKDHMPFDPMYQFMSYPLSNREFAQGAADAGRKKTLFNFTDSLKQYDQMADKDRVTHELGRIQSIGIENDLIKGWIDYLTRRNEAYNSKNDYEQAVDLYNRATLFFNQYIGSKNKQFTNVQEDNDVVRMLDSTTYYARTAWSTLGTVKAKDEANRQALSSAYRAIEQLQNQVNKEKGFVETYIRTDKASRMRLFMRR